LALSAYEGIGVTIVNRSDGLGGVNFGVGFASPTDVFNGYVDNFTKVHLRDGAAGASGCGGKYSKDCLAGFVTTVPPFAVYGSARRANQRGWWFALSSPIFKNFSIPI
jgi:hypothetical protein